MTGPVGRPLPHDAALLHVTGRARYVDDIPAPASTLHLAFGLSDVAHGGSRRWILRPCARPPAWWPC